MIRSLHLADIVALLLFLGKSPINEARSRDRIDIKGEGLLIAVPLLKDLLISGDKQHSFIYVHRGLIQGLVSLQRCRGPRAWMVEHLLLIPGHEDHCVDLLERLGFTGDKIKAERIFLRLGSSSPSVDMARQAGFNHYLTEYLYCLREAHQTKLQEPPPALRPPSSADEHGLFRLYSVVAPQKVRYAEGMTLEEWCQSRDKDAPRELVSESGGEISAWLRIRQDRMSGQFDIMTRLEAGELTNLVEYSLSMLKGRNAIYCLVPEFQPQLRRILEYKGFSQVGEYFCLSKQLAVRVCEPQLVPLRA